ncbi:hypothetical protein E2C01_024795 [Portunus trituberculatus]|uniref:Secreted protein n=1 Tax=Portunus trituberculatus TaxID=210409 RepID=A0A5B7EDR8_PORTR|nr:hypothetical protein [Portunus trituberculatus]
MLASPGSSWPSMMPSTLYTVLRWCWSFTTTVTCAPPASCGPRVAWCEEVPLELEGAQLCGTRWGKHSGGIGVQGSQWCSISRNNIGSVSSNLSNPHTTEAVEGVDLLLTG